MEHWDDYWQYSQQTVNDDAWNRAAKATWSSVLASILPHWKCLDLACGNGHLIQLLSAKGAHWTGTDLAKISPPTGIEYHPRVPLEKQPFDSGQFDLVVSQFGIEYGPRPEAFNEALRVLKSGGQFQFLMHHRTSSISTALAAENRDIEHLKSGRLSAAIEALLVALSSQETAANQFGITSAVEAVKTELSLIARTASAGFVQYLNQGINHVVNRMPQHAVQQRIDAWRQGVDALWLCHRRNADQLEAALDSDMIQRLSSQLVSQVTRIESRLIESDGEVVGWCLSGTKA